MIKELFKNLFQKSQDFADESEQNAVTTANTYADTMMTQKTTLLASTNVTSATTYTLTDDFTNYKLIVISVAANGAEWKNYVKLPQYSENLDVSWNATDSTSWYVICRLNFDTTNPTSVKVNSITKSGFSTFNLRIDGLK